MVHTTINTPFILPFTIMEVEMSTGLRFTITKDESLIQAHPVQLSTKVSQRSDHRATLNQTSRHEEQRIHRDQNLDRNRGNSQYQTKGTP